MDGTLNRGPGSGPDFASQQRDTVRSPMNGLTKERVVVVRVSGPLLTEIENAKARYGTTRSTLIRCALRKYLDGLTEAEIREDMAEDQRIHNDGARRRARRHLKQMREGT